MWGGLLRVIESDCHEWSVHSCDKSMFGKLCHGVFSPQNFQTVSGTIPTPISDGILELESEVTALKMLLQTLQ